MTPSPRLSLIVAAVALATAPTWAVRTNPAAPHHRPFDTTPLTPPGPGYPDITPIVHTIAQHMTPATLHRSSMAVAGYAHRQVLVVDVSSKFGTLFNNLLLSLSRVGTPRIIALSVDGVCSDPRIHGYSIDVRCIELDGVLQKTSALLETTTVDSLYRRERGAQGNLWELMLVRSIAMWQVTAHGYGVTLLDADLAFFHNYFSHDLAAYAVVTGVNHSLCDDMHHCIPVAGETGTCQTPIPPITYQPSMAAMLHNVSWEYARSPVVVTSMWCASLFAHIKPDPDPAAGGDAACRPMVGPHGERVCLLTSDRVLSRCDAGRVTPHNRTHVMSYHANCSPVVAEQDWEASKIQQLKEEGAWFLEE